MFYFNVKSMARIAHNILYCMISPRDEATCGGSDRKLIAHYCSRAVLYSKVHTGPPNQHTRAILTNALCKKKHSAHREILYTFKLCMMEKKKEDEQNRNLYVWFFQLQTKMLMEIAYRPHTHVV